MRRKLRSQAPPGAQREEATSVERAQASEYLDAGARLVNEGRWEEARRYLEASVVLVPTSAHAQYLLGVCLDRLGDAGGSEEALRRCVELNPDHAWACNALGMILGRMELYAEANRYLARAAFLGNEQAKETLSKAGKAACHACGRLTTVYERLTTGIVFVTPDFDWSTVGWKCDHCGDTYCGRCARAKRPRRRKDLLGLMFRVLKEPEAPKCPACQARMS